MKTTLLNAGLLSLVLAATGQARTFFVDASAAAGGDGSAGAPFRKIQNGLSHARAGDVVSVASGTYREKLSFPRSGQSGSKITLRAEDGARVVVDGRGRAGRNVIIINNKSHIVIEGLRLQNKAASNGAALIRINGTGDGIRIRENVLSDIRGKNVVGIGVYGTSGTNAIRDLDIHENIVQDIQAGTRAGILLSGNVVDFDVDRNLVRDISGAGIGLFGGYDTTGNDDADRPRLGRVELNLVDNAFSKGDVEFVAGISLDGASSNTVQRNEVSHCDVGIELTAEQDSGVTSGNLVRENLVFRNSKAGIVLGADDGNDGRVSSNNLKRNALFANASGDEDLGEFVIRFARNNTFVNNKVQTAQSSNFLIFSEETNANVKNTSNHNVFFSPAGKNKALFMWQGVEYIGFREYQRGSGEDKGSDFRKTQIEI